MLTSVIFMTNKRKADLNIIDTARNQGFVSLVPNHLKTFCEISSLFHIRLNTNIVKQIIKKISYSVLG